MKYTEESLDRCPKQKKKKKKHWGHRYSLEVKHLPSMGEALGSIPSTAKETTKRRIISERWRLGWYYYNSADSQSFTIILQLYKTLIKRYQEKGIGDCSFYNFAVHLKLVLRVLEVSHITLSHQNTKGQNEEIKLSI